MKKIFISFSIVAFLFGCNSANNHPKPNTNKGLKDYYKNYFPIGVAVNEHNITGVQGKLILKEFNSVTPENAMKWAPIEPFQNVYFWKNADSIVAFAKRNHIRIRGHNLCWHQQTPPWLFVNKNGKTVSKDTLLQRLKSHVFTVVNRYKDAVYAWDVVNEAIDDDSTKFLRNSKWYQICGEDFIDSAFVWAHEADPKAQLFYNDYNVIRPQKRERVYKLLKGLLAKKIPVTGIGIQAHWSVYEPTQDELETAIKEFASLGLKVQFTEVDISIFPWEKNQRAKKPNENDTYTDALKAKQAAEYKMVFSVFRKYKKYINSVTFWNLSDKDTWLDHYPVEGRKNYPLLFDTALQRKPVYWDVVKW
ncbi:1,4-beta-xylanase [Arachidicoccus ginsenosidimutans]|uniref:endo-1,4-beta-xylanase n=1 Tax=Arachidicoccus sp. BS20 TaxID=1850526 RepID=UPI0007F17EF6|nr:endo-1,4-beta-xylanase [Arachidicoccus sp. BS20]ANI88785.1 1,4-beta-xylanase [Arachidicoccus sp. BS20]